MPKEIIKLNNNQLSALKVIDRVYTGSGKGCKSIEITVDHRTLQLLLDQGLVFKTKEGWFPSTKGQDYLLQYGN